MTELLTTPLLVLLALVVLVVLVPLVPLLLVSAPIFLFTLFCDDAVVVDDDAVDAVESDHDNDPAAKL